MSRILVVDDETSMREVMELFLVDEGYEVESASDGDGAIARLDETEFDLVLTDLKMARMGGLQVLDHTKATWPETQVVVMTAYSTTKTAVEAMKRGAYDYISKPFSMDEIQVVIEKALEKRALSQQVRELKGELQSKYAFSNIVGRSAAMRQVYEIIERIAGTRTSVLITGSSGTGKELVARALHFNSPRGENPFVVVNCGAIPENLMESEFFGHTKGAFTGAVAAKKGLFEAAHTGTIFLDEIGELPLALQVKLLRSVQERRIKPLGSTDEFDVDVRVIAATNKDLAELVSKGEFREDLYYRLNVIQVQLPPLRERVEDIPLLVNHFLGKFAEELGKPIVGLAPEAMEALMAYPYTGNVRELQNVIERAVAFEATNRITLDSLPRHVVDRRAPGKSAAEAIALPPDGMDLEGILADLEKSLLRQALRRTGGNRTEAARLLGVTFRSIRYKLAKYDVTDDTIDDWLRMN